jgi:hypothetical protein
MIGVIRFLHLHVLVEAGFGGIVLVRLRQRLAILKKRIGKMRNSGERFAKFIVGAIVEFLFMLQRRLADEYRAIFIVRDGRGAGWPAL